MSSEEKTLQYGESVPRYDIPVLNEREIRAAAGMLFLWLLISFILVVARKDFVSIKYFIIVFAVDLLVRVYVDPKYSPMLILGRLIVRNQTPEYVGAAQKRFAWKIGLALSSVIFGLLVVLNTVSVFTFLACLSCLIFLYFETAFGICLGCLLYRWRYKEQAQYCPGEVCEVGSRQAIQRTSRTQLVSLIGLASLLVLIVLISNEYLGSQPQDLFEVLGAALAD